MSSDQTQMQTSWMQDICMNNFILELPPPTSGRNMTTIELQQHPTHSTCLHLYHISTVLSFWWIWNNPSKHIIQLTLCTLLTCCLTPNIIYIKWFQVTMLSLIRGKYSSYETREFFWCEAYAFEIKFLSSFVSR